MKIVRTSALFLALSTLLVTQTGCFGEFQLTRKFYGWHEGVSNNKFVRTLVFWVTSIGYPITTAVDFFILNLIEFWSGSNPLSMNEGDHEMQLATVNGEEFRIEATKDTFTTTQLTGKEAGEVRIMKFDRATRTWNYTDSEVIDRPVITFLDDQAENVRIHTNNGTVELSTADLADQAALRAKFTGCGSEGMASAN
jgi:hypothetical protein